MTVHISNLGEIVDPGSDKTTDEELELNAAGKLKEDDNESVGVMSEVGDSTKDANGKEVDSPYSDLVNVGSSFVYTVDRNKVDKNPKYLYYSRKYIQTYSNQLTRKDYQTPR